MKLGLFEVLGLIATAQLFILALFLFTHEKGKKLNNQLLGAFLLGNGLILLDVIQIHSGWYLKFPHLVTAGFSTTLLYGPILYLYTRSASQPGFKIRIVHLVHAIPFIIYCSLMIPVFFILDADSKIIAIEAGFIVSKEISILGYGIIHLQVIGYLVISIYWVYQNPNKSDAYQSLNWLKLVLFGFLLMWAGDLILVLTADSVTMPTQIIQWFPFLAVLLYFVFVNMAVYMGLKHPGLFATQKTKYANSLLTDRERIDIIERLESYMAEKAPYIMSSITVDATANALHVSSRNLSQAINETFQRSFIDYINQHRIDKAKYLLQNKSDAKKTVLEIMYEVGFNSKSAFNKAFKKETGTTPTDFRSNST